MRTEVRQKFLRFFNKFRLLKTNWIKKEDQGILIPYRNREESAESLSE